MNQRSKLLAIISLMPLLPVSAWSQDLDLGPPVNCISLSRIDRTEVIDEQTIAFFLRGSKDIYINRLAQSCRGLDREQRFSYRTSTGRLCSADSITVLENYGFGLSAGASCGLGMFVPADKETVERLKSDEEPAKVTVEPIKIDPTVENDATATE